MSITRALVLWLLMLALPLQGLASVRWADCHADHGAHAMHHAPTEAADDAAPAADDATSCNVCAACSMTAAPAPALPVLPQAAVPERAAPRVADGLPSAPSHRLERPPRPGATA